MTTPDNAPPNAPPNAPANTPGELPAGHPLDLFLCENEAIGAEVHELREILRKIGEKTTAGAGLDELAENLRTRVTRLRQVANHYARKENLYFVYLEKYDVVEPARDMWRLDADIRRELQLLSDQFGEPRDLPAWQDTAAKQAVLLLNMIEAMIIAEEQGLLPHCTARFTPADWAEIHHESARFGACLVTPGQEYVPPDLPPHRPYLHGVEDVALRLATGQLTPRQLEGLFAALPLDLTFVDVDDRVVFYSDTPGRLFSRSPAVIGRPLKHCHPPASEPLLDRIMADLRSGHTAAVESMTERDGRLLHTRYIAVRDGVGQYLGCLEMAQDITPLHELRRDGRWPRYEVVPDAEPPKS